MADQTSGTTHPDQVFRELRRLAQAHGFILHRAEMDSIAPVRIGMHCRYRFTAARNDLEPPPPVAGTAPEAGLAD